MPDSLVASPAAAGIVLAICAAILVGAGTRFTRVVDEIADRTGIGEALAGAVLLGATTSLPGLVVTGVAATRGAADLAVSNALGGIAAQTVFLAVGDLLYRRANLEHAAASVPNLMQTAVLMVLLALVLMASLGPQATWAGIHPASAALLVAYGGGLWLSRSARETPMWHPRRTEETRLDEPDEALDPPGRGLWAQLLLLGAVVAACGHAIARAGLALSEQTGLGGTLVGGLFTSVVTSLPELVTMIAAVRAGALQLAVADIIGGNTFDVLFLSVADAFYREGSIYEAAGRAPLFLCALTTLLTAILMLGLLFRQRRGIGFEGTAILLVYAVGFAVLSSMR